MRARVCVCVWTCVVMCVRAPVGARVLVGGPVCVCVYMCASVRKRNLRRCGLGRLVGLVYGAKCRDKVGLTGSGRRWAAAAVGRAGPTGEEMSRSETPNYTLLNY